MAGGREEGRKGGSGTRQGRDFTEERKATEMHPARRKETVAVAQQHKDRAGGGVVACSLTLYPSAFLTWQSRSTSLPTGTVMLSISPTKDGAEAAAAASLLTVCASGGGRQAPESSRLVVATPGTMGERTQYFTFLIVNLARVIK